MRRSEPSREIRVTLSAGIPGGSIDSVHGDLPAGTITHLHTLHRPATLGTGRTFGFDWRVRRTVIDFRQIGILGRFDHPQQFFAMLQILGTKRIAKRSVIADLV